MSSIAVSDDHEVVAQILRDARAARRKSIGVSVTTSVAGYWRRTAPKNTKLKRCV